MQIKKNEIGKDFRNFIDCPLSLKDYETILKEKGLI
jgi:hypothetical protein